MTNDYSPDYYLRRERQERALAAAATSPAIGRIHEDLANHYRVKILDAERACTRSRLSIVTAG